MNYKAYFAYNFKSLLETEGLLKVTGCNMLSICGNVSEAVLDMSRYYYKPLIGSGIWPIEWWQS